MDPLTHDEVRALKVGDRFHLVYFEDDEKKNKVFDGDVVVDDVSDMDICCATGAFGVGPYISIMLTSPDGSGKAWPLDKAPGRGWFEFYQGEGYLETAVRFPSGVFLFRKD